MANDSHQSGLSADELELLALMLEQEGIEVTADQAIKPRPDPTHLPLSFAQERLWFLNHWEPGSPVYNIPQAVLLRGALNHAALEQSINLIVQRHDVLRASFAERNGEPTQQIAPALSLSLPVIDLQALPASERQAQARQLALHESQQPFDLAQGPLVRCSLLKLAAQEHVLLLTIHHIVFDGWSMGVLFQELMMLYAALVRGQQPALPALPIQYADFAFWQRQWLQGERLEQQLAYWREQLAGAPTVLDLPTDYLRPAVQSFRGNHQQFSLSQPLSEALKALSQAEEASLFMTLLAAFQTLLYRYSGQEDVLVGTPIANRHHSELEGLIGFFVNSLVLRGDLRGNPSFRELLRRVREVCLGAYAHQDLPFEKLVNELHPQRDLSRNPLFQVMLSLQNAPMEPLALPDLSVDNLETEGRVARVDLTLAFVETSKGIEAELEYNTDLFAPGTISRLVEHLQTLLAGIVANPDQRLADLPVLSAAEQHLLLIDWNANQLPYDHEACLHQLVEAQVARTPEAIAMTWGEQQLTFAQLDAQANHLAALLRARGVGPEIRVAIFLERSLTMVIGLLAILKAGGTYVPLDPAYPQERLAFMLEDSTAALLLTQQSLRDLIDFAEQQVIYLDGDWATQLDRAPSSAVAAPTSANLAYLIYTSGSTGRPKAVAITHQNAVAFCAWAHNTFTPADFQSVMAPTSICFDISIFEIFATLSAGGKVVLVENALALPQVPASARITLLNMVPSAMAELLRQNAIPSSVQTVNLAGESLPLRLVQQVYQQPNVQQVLNFYGPSEDTTYSTVAWVPRDATTPPLIGRPIANSQVYLVDRQLRPVPLGAIGELYIAGDGLARGYLGRPDLTAERWLPNPFSQHPEGTPGPGPGARMYKTGDLARYQPDGQLMFLSRIDHQVKIRGFRIELGEVESVLRQHPQIQDVVLLAREDTPGDKRIVAYLVAQPDQRPTVGELRAFAKEKLPEYMIPAVFMLLEAMPLLPNGKINRHQLPIPDAARPELGTALVAPRTATEQLVHDIWLEVLGLTQIGIDDDFFALGGHSLLATQVTARVRNASQVALTVRTLFENPTIASFAAALDQLKAAAPGSKAPTIGRAARQLRNVTISAQGVVTDSEDQQQA